MAYPQYSAWPDDMMELDPPDFFDEQDEDEEYDLTYDYPGPKQTRKPDAVANTQFANAQTTPTKPVYDPMTLLSPREFPAGRTSQQNGQTDKYRVSPTPKTHYDGEHEEAGMSSFIERMHGVQKRDSRYNPQKRRKVEAEGSGSDEEVDNNKQKSDFNSNSRGGGVLTTHLKQQREEMGASAGPIDLTAEDDDLQVISENVAPSSGNEEINIGRIMAKANMHRIPFVSARALSAMGPSRWPRVKVEHKRNPAEHSIIDLYDRSGKKFGKLDATVSLALCPLLDRPELHKLRCAVWLDDRPRKPDETVGSAVSLYVAVSILIFCKRSSAEKIGKFLSQRNIFLSPPPGAGNGHVEYENPQVPKDYSGRGLVAGRAQQGSGAPTMQRTVEEMRRDAGNMIDSLAKHEDLPEMEADPKFITTPLLAHQKQGLCFLVDHERPDQNETVSLWKENLKKNGDKIYYHIITGHEVDERPANIQGGILADMMGLGKTLSILSLVAATRAESIAFGKTEATDQCDLNVKATLIVCPKSVMSNWHEQIKAHAKSSAFKVYTYHGQSRTNSAEDLAKYHVVLTTYNTAAAELSGKYKTLAAVKWFRIVLDEAHQIRNLNTQVAKACCALEAQRRWAVTGTPVQNALNDLGALIKFLRVQPFDQSQAWAQYIIAPFRMANTDAYQHLRLLVDSITLRRVKDSIELTKRSEKQVTLEMSDEERKTYAMVALTSNRQLKLMTGGADKALKGRSYAHVLKSIGRMRMLCAHGLDMFNDDDRREITEGMDPNNAIAIDLGDEPGMGEYQFVSERQAYETLHMMTDSAVNPCIKCDRKIGDTDNAEEDENAEESDSDSEEDAKDDAVDSVLGYLTPCYHLVCPLCKEGHDKTIKPNLTEDERYICQYCEAYVRYGNFELRRFALRNFIEARNAKVKNTKNRRWDESNYNGPSTKVRALIEDLKFSAEETRKLGPDAPPIRSVVFSGWTTYLSLIEVALEEHGFAYVRLDGSMSIKQRTAVLTQFKTDPTILVLLVSIKAGGQGLNFTAANKVYMMEPQFNPGVEQQAIDRVHRLGQTRDVEVTHYIMKDSVEEGIQKLQKKKEELANLSLNRKMTTIELQKQKLEDLKELFK